MKCHKVDKTVTRSSESQGRSKASTILILFAMPLIQKPYHTAEITVENKLEVVL